MCPNEFDQNTHKRHVLPTNNFPIHVLFNERFLSSSSLSDNSKNYSHMSTPTRTMTMIRKATVILLIALFSSIIVLSFPTVPTTSSPLSPFLNNLHIILNAASSLKSTNNSIHHHEENYHHHSGDDDDENDNINNHIICAAAAIVGESQVPSSGMRVARSLSDPIISAVSTFSSWMLPSHSSRIVSTDTITASSAFGGMVRFAAAARPTDCSAASNPTPFTDLQTIILDAADTDYAYTIDGCSYNNGLHIKGVNSATVLTKVRILIDNAVIKNNRFSIDSGLSFGQGSSFTLTRSTISAISYIDFYSKLTGNDAFVSIVSNTILFSGSSTGGLIVGSAMAVADGTKISIRQNTIGTLGTTNQLIRVYTQSASTAIFSYVVPLSIEDNTLNCATYCIYINGILNTTVKRNVFTTTTAGTSVYVLFDGTLYGGSIDWDGTNIFEKPYYNFNLLANSGINPLTPSRILLNGTRPNAITINLDSSTTPLAPVSSLRPFHSGFSTSVFNFTNVIASAGATFNLGTHNSAGQTLLLDNSQWGRTVIVSGSFTSSQHELRLSQLSMGTDATLQLSNVYTYGKLFVEDNTFAPGSGVITASTNIHAIDNAMLFFRRNSFATSGNAGAMTQLNLYWSRSGVGFPQLVISDNIFRFVTSDSNDYAIYLRSRESNFIVPSNFIIANNSFEMNDGTSIYMDLNNADAMTVRQNKLLSTRTILSATLANSKIIFDDSNVFAAGVSGGSVIINHNTAPRDSSYVKLPKNARIAQFSYVHPASTAPRNTSIILESITIASNIVVDLALASDPFIVLNNIIASGSTASSYSFQVARTFYHNFSTYTGGLNLNLKSDVDIVLSFLIISATSTWTIEAPRVFRVEYNVLPAVYVTLKQSSDDHAFLFDHNILISSNPASGYPYYLNYGLLVSWSRKGSLTTATLTVTNNTITFSPPAATAASQAIYIDSDDNSDTTTNMAAYITDNDINAGLGTALRVDVKSTDLTIQRNKITANTRFVDIDLINSKIIFDPSNELVGYTAGAGIIDIRHVTMTPRDGSVFNITGLRIAAVSYLIEVANAYPKGFVVAATNLLLGTNIIINMNAAVPAVFDLRDIQTVTTTTTASSYTVSGINFYHNYSSYYGGLTLNVNSPLNISLCYLVVGRSSSWTVNAKNWLNISRSYLPALIITTEQDTANHQLIFDDNVVVSSNPDVSYPFYVNYAVLFNWVRSGLGNAYFSFQRNQVSFTATTAASNAMYIESDNSDGYTNLIAHIISNDINVGAGHAFNLFLSAADVTIRYNNIVSNNFFVDADLKDCRIEFDQTNTLNTNGGGFDIRSTNPRNGNIFNISNERLKSIRYEYPTAANAPRNDRIEVSHMNLQQNIVIDLASAVTPILILEDIVTVAAASKSTYRVKTIDFIHHTSTYPGGLDLTIESPRNITLYNLNIGVTSAWTLTAPLSFKLLNNQLPAIRLSLTQNLDNNNIEIVGNTITSTNPDVSYPYYISYGLLLDWTRSGLGNSKLVLANNLIRFTATTSATRGVYLLSKGTTAPNAVITIANNDIENLNGLCFDLSLENVDLSFANTILSTNNVGIKASLTRSRVSMNESNTHSMNGGDISIVHESSPRDNNIVNITHQRIGQFVYQVKVATDTPRNDVIVASDLILSKNLVIAMGNSQKPTLRIERIQTGNSKSSIQVQTLDMVHNYSTYPGGLDLTIDAPDYIILHDLVIGSPSVWNLNTGRLLNVTRCKLPALRINPIMDDFLPDPTIIFEYNTIVSTNPEISYPYYISYGILMDWSRTGTGTGYLSFSHNVVTFTANTAASRGLYLATKAVGNAVAPNTVTLIWNNSITLPNNGYCFDLRIISTDLTMRENTFATGAAGWGIHADLTDVRAVIDDSNLQQQNGGAIDIEHIASPRNNNYINISDEIVQSFRYVHPDAAVTSGDEIRVNNVVLQGLIQVRLGQSDKPLVVLNKITSYSGKSNYMMRTVDFIHGGQCTYVGGLDLDIVAPLNITLFDLTIGATSRWIFVAPAVMRVVNSNLPALYITITQTFVNPLILFEGNTIVSANPSVSYPYYVSYAILLDWTRSGIGTASFNFNKNDISFSASSSASRSLYFKSDGASSAVTPMVADITNNKFNTGGGVALDTSISNADVTISGNLMYATAAALNAIFTTSRVTFDDSNDHLQGGGSVTIAHTTPRNGSYVVVRNERIAAFSYTVSPATHMAKNDTIIIEDMIINGAMVINLADSVRPKLVLERITAAVTSNAESSVVASDVETFIHHHCTYNFGLDLNIDSPVNITLHDLTVLGANNFWNLRSPQIIQIVGNVLNEIFISATTNGDSPNVLVTRNNVEYNAGYRYSSTYGTCGMAILWLRNTIGTPRLTVTNNEILRVGTSTAAVESLKIISTTAPSTFGEINVTQNKISTKSAAGLVLETLNADISVQKNTFNNYASGTVYSLSATLSGSRITFDDSNEIIPGAGGIYVSHTVNPRPNNVVIVSKAVISSFMYAVSAGPVRCDRVALIESIVDTTMSIDIAADVYDSEFTIFGSTAGAITSTTARSLARMNAMYNSFLRLEKNAFLGLDVRGYVTQLTSSLSFTKNTAKSYTTFSTGGSLGTTDIRGNIFTSTSTSYPAIQLSLLMGGSPVLLLADNRVEIITAGNVASIVTTCAVYTFGSATQTNSTILLTNNFLSGAGTNSIYACRGVLLMRNNFLNPLATINHRIGDRASHLVRESDGNVFAGCAVSYSIDSSATGATIDVSWRDTSFTSFDYSVNSEYHRVSLNGIQISGALSIRPTLGTDADSASIRVNNIAVGGLSTITLTNPVNRFGFVQVQSSTFLGGFIGTASSIASSVLISDQSRFVIDSCTINTVMTLTFRTLAFGWRLSNSTITTAASQTSQISTLLDNAIGDVYGNNFLKAAASARLTFSIAGTSLYSGATIISKNTFDTVFTLVSSGQTYGQSEFSGNIFTDTVTFNTVVTSKLHLFGNTFSSVGSISKSFASGAMAGDALQSGCNRDAAASNGIIDFSTSAFDVRFTEFSCGSGTSVGFCFGRRSASITSANTQALCGSTSSTTAGSTSDFDNTAGWSVFPVNVENYIAVFSLPRTISPISESQCVRNPVYDLGNVTWPPEITIPTTTQATVTLTPPSTVTDGTTTFTSATTTTTSTPIATSTEITSESPIPTTPSSESTTTTADPSSSTSVIPTTPITDSSGNTVLPPSGSTEVPTSTYTYVTPDPANPSTTPTGPTYTYVTPTASGATIPTTDIPDDDTSTTVNPSDATPTSTDPSGSTAGTSDDSSSSSAASPTETGSDVSNATTTEEPSYPTDTNGSPVTPSPTPFVPSTTSDNTNEPSSSSSDVSTSAPSGVTADTSSSDGPSSITAVTPTTGVPTDNSGNTIVPQPTSSVDPTMTTTGGGGSDSSSSSSTNDVTTATALPTTSPMAPTTAGPTAPTTTPWPAYTTTPRPYLPLVACPRLTINPTDLFADPKTSDTIDVTITVEYTVVKGGYAASSPSGNDDTHSLTGPFIAEGSLYDGPALLINASFGLVTNLLHAPSIDDTTNVFHHGTNSFIPLGCSPVGSYTLKCSVPSENLASSGVYHIVSNNYVVQPHPNCSSNLQGPVNFIRANSAANDASDATASTVAAGASILSLLSAADMQLYAMLLASPCTSENDKARVSILQYFLSPFISEGHTWVILGGFFVILAVTLAQLGISWYFVQSRRVSWGDATAACRFPSVSYIVACYMYAGIANSSFAMFDMRDTMVDIAGLFGIVILIIVPCVCWYYTHQVFVGKWQPYTQFYSKPPQSRWLFPDGFWQPPQQRKPFSGMFLFCRDQRLYFAPYSLIVTILVSLFLNSFGDKIPCYERLIIVSIIFFLAAIFVAVVRPHRRPASCIIEVTSYTLLGIQCVLKAMMHADEADRDGLADIDVIVSYLYLAVVVIRVVSEIIYVSLEKKYWMRFFSADGDEDVENMGKSRALMGDDDDVEAGVISLYDAPSKKRVLKNKKTVGAVNTLGTINGGEGELLGKSAKSVGDFSSSDSEIDLDNISADNLNAGGGGKSNGSFAMEMQPVAAASTSRGPSTGGSPAQTSDNKTKTSQKQYDLDSSDSDAMSSSSSSSSSYSTALYSSSSRAASSAPQSPVVPAKQGDSESDEMSL